MEFRRIFDTIPEQFDQFRPRYSLELFEYLIQYAKIGPEMSVLEIGPGTGQATDPILQTGSYDFGQQQFDMVYSAASIQWIPEQIAFSKTFELLKPGGILAMMLTKSDYKSTNEELYEKIQRLYDQYYKPDIPYTHGGFKYDHASKYGFVDFEKRDFHGRRELNPDEYVSFCGTHCDHIVIPEPYKTPFFEGLRKVVAENGGKVVFEDTYVLYLTRKPLTATSEK